MYAPPVLSFSATMWIIAIVAGLAFLILRRRGYLRSRAGAGIVIAIVGLPLLASIIHALTEG